MSTIDPARSSAATTASCPSCAANMSGVEPSLVAEFTPV
eukprot:CAMPEP_0181388912 /NCGR_PEP_ID=MMETSP1106-20121128/24589_1 /TAXON_ID=81844 /ORGANISM="Mantoniella antarctica, Strain SL-175" /LENGTH=38 /DNA_ID= /DNA_START= /DNA_END= /DNA_ORIENTATION=